MGKNAGRCRNLSGGEKKNWKRWLWPVLLVLLGALAAFELLRPDLRQSGAVPVNDGSGTIWIEPDPNLPRSSLKSSDFDRLGSAIVYTGSGYAAYQGVDVSEWQKSIRWQEVADSGVDFAVIRCGFRRAVMGTLEQDLLFEDNYTGAGEAGLRRGLYFFSQAVSVEEAEAEAAYTLELLGGRALELPIFFDWETVDDPEARSLGVSGETVTACAAAFCRVIEAAGYKAGIYFNLQMGYHNYDLGQFSAQTLWLAEPAEHPTFFYETALWQYDHHGTVTGIDTEADRNLLFEKTEESKN